MSHNYIIKEDCLYILKSYSENANDIKRFFYTEFELNQDYLQAVKLFENSAPDFQTPAANILARIISNVGVNIGDQREVTKYDFQNAKKLYEELKINRVQASDPRLWSYLCLEPYYNYIKKRHLPRTAKQKVLRIDKYYEYNPREQKTLHDYISDRFFIESNPRSMLRLNGLSRLWWAVDMTYSPWDRWEGIKQTSEDKYYYSKIIFADTDLYQQLFDRLYSRDVRIAFPIIDVIIENRLNRSSMRTLLIKLNSYLAFRNLYVFDYKTIKNEITLLLN